MACHLFLCVKGPREDVPIGGGPAEGRRPFTPARRTRVSDSLRRVE